jgi:uncharacterized protein DUF3866
VLKLRRGVVTGTDPLRVRIGEEERPAWADVSLVGEVLEGDELILNTEARDLGLGSGGFDVVHVNLTRGLEASGADGATALKLNYTSLQHPVEPVEARGRDGFARRIPVLVISLHGQLAPAAWAAARAAPGLRVGYVQTSGGALPGSLTEDVAELRRTGLLCAHLTAGPAYGGELEAITVIGALQAAAGPLGWDAVIVGPGPGIVGSDSELGHGGMEALDAAHASLILGHETLLAPRMSSADPRDRHRGLSHHTATVLRMLLGNVRVPAPARQSADWPPIGGDGSLEELRRACGERHEIWPRPAPVDEYAESGLPTAHMGRELPEDRLFFASALASGDALAEATVAELAA